MLPKFHSDYEQSHDPLASAKTAVTQHAIFHGLTCYFFFNMLEFKYRRDEINLGFWNINNMLKTKQHVIDI
jgi:hypothetical protein